MEAWNLSKYNGEKYEGRFHNHYNSVWCETFYSINYNYNYNLKLRVPEFWYFSIVDFFQVLWKKVVVLLCCFAEAHVA